MDRTGAAPLGNPCAPHDNVVVAQARKNADFGEIGHAFRTWQNLSEFKPKRPSELRPK